MKQMLSCLLICVLTAGMMRADSGPDPEHVRSIKKNVAECVDRHRRVVVETFDNRRLQGMISEAGENDFVLTIGGRATTLAYADVSKIKWPSSVWKEVKVFAGAAAIAGGILLAVVLLGGLRG